MVGEFLDGYAVNGTVRISIGYFNTNYEIEKILESLEEIIRG